MPNGAEKQNIKLIDVGGSKKPPASVELITEGGGRSPPPVLMGFLCKGTTVASTFRVAGATGAACQHNHVHGAALEAATNHQLDN